MKIFKPIICLLTLLALAPYRAFASDLSQFLTQRQISPTQLGELCGKDKKIRRCVQTPTHLVCVNSGLYANTGTNPQTRLAVLRGLAFTSKMQLYSSLVKSNAPTNLRNAERAHDIYLKEVRNGNDSYTLKGIEFQTYSEGNWCAAVASVPLVIAAKLLHYNYSQPFFISAYCQALLSHAQMFMAEGNYTKALTLLKELPTLEFTNMTVDLMTATALMRSGQTEQAKEIALKALHDGMTTITSQQAEALGDVFFELGCSKDAEAAYTLAQEKL